MLILSQGTTCVLVGIKQAIIGATLIKTARGLPAHVENAGIDAKIFDFGLIPGTNCIP